MNPTNNIDQLERKWVYSGVYSLKDLSFYPESILKEIIVGVNTVIGDLSNDGAICFEVQAVNLIDEELNPEKDNISVRVCGLRKKPNSETIGLT